MSFLFDDEQVVPDSVLEGSDESSVSSQSSSASCDSDSSSSQGSTDVNLLPKVNRHYCRSKKRLHPICLERLSLTDTRTAVSVMQRLTDRMIRRAARKGHGKYLTNKAVRQVMKRDIERRSRFISELREDNREIAKQMRQTEAEFSKLFETVATSSAGSAIFPVKFQ